MEIRVKNVRLVPKSFKARKMKSIQVENRRKLEWLTSTLAFPDLLSDQLVKSTKFNPPMKARQPMPTLMTDLKQDHFPSMRHVDR